MTKIGPAKQLILAAFVAGWSDAYTFDNEDPEPLAFPWARAVVRHRTSEQTSLGGVGNRKFERAGSVIVQIFDTLDNGSATADNLAETVQTIFEGKTLTDGSDRVVFTNAVIREIGPTDDGYQINVEAFFTYDEVK